MVTAVEMLIAAVVDVVCAVFVNRALISSVPVIKFVCAVVFSAFVSAIVWLVVIFEFVCTSMDAVVALIFCDVDITAFVCIAVVATISLLVVAVVDASLVIAVDAVIV